MEENEEIRVTSGTGGQKGKKPCQLSLVPPYVRRKLIDSVDADSLLKEAAEFMLQTEEGIDMTLQLVDVLTEYVNIRGTGADNALRSMGRVYGAGADKYSRNNYLKGYEWSLTVDAFWRHWLEEVGGAVANPDSGEPHASHMLWHAIALHIFAEREIGENDTIWAQGREGYCGWGAE